MTACALTRRCPRCSAALAVRRARDTAEPFVGCTRYPACRYTSAYDEELDELYEDLDRLASEVEALRARLDRQAGASADAAPAPADLDRELKRLVFDLHPDRRGATVPAAEVTAKLNALRARFTQRRASA